MVSIVAHRGDSSAYRENTLTACRSAIDAGADRIELDVRTTTDGVSVVLHDRTLLRLWGRSARIEELDWPQVAEIGYADLRIPRLMDALKVVVGTGVGLLIDVGAAADARAAWAVVEPFEAAGADLDVHWCGDPAAMAEIRRLSPSAIIYLATDSGSAGGADLMSLRPTYLNMEATVATAQVVQDAHAVGLGVCVWTVDDPGVMRYLLAIGVDAIITNDVRLLRAVIATPGIDPVAAMAADGEGPLTELAVARDLAGWATAYLRTMRPATISSKATPADVVTDVDVSVERRVRDVLAAAFPGHAIVGEELGGRAATSGPCWYLDPIDGTTNFAHDLAWSSFSLALAVDGLPRLGVVGDPWRGEVLWGATGLGAYRDGTPLACERPAESAESAGPGEPGEPGSPADLGDPRDPQVLAGALVLAEWDGHRPWPGMLSLLQEAADLGMTTRIMGSGALAIASVAAGRAAAAVIGTFQPVDHLAALILAREAGAQVIDPTGPAAAMPAPMPGPGPLLVAAPWRAAQLTAVLARHCIPGSPAE